MSGFSDRRTRDKSLWTFWSLLDCSLFSSSCASSNNFFGEPGMGERLWTNKCLTIDFPMVSPCIIPIKVSHKQAKNMLLSIFMEVSNSQLRTVWYERSRDKNDVIYSVTVHISHISLSPTNHVRATRAWLMKQGNKSNFWRLQKIGFLMFASCWQ